MKYTNKLILDGVEYQFAEGSSGRQPSANTIAYCPLEQDGDDATGNYTFTTLNTGDLSYFDNGYGLDVLSKSSTSNFEYTLCSTIAGTIGIWAKMGSHPTYDDNGTIISQGQHYGIFYDNGWGHDTGIAIRLEESDHTEHWSAHYKTNLTDWHLYMFTYDGTDAQFYVDGQLFDTITIQSLLSITELNLLGIDTNNWARGIQGQFSKALWEIPAWTAQEVSDYFNQTKSLYGIS